MKINTSSFIKQKHGLKLDTNRHFKKTQFSMPENDSDEQSQLSYYENNCPIHNSSRVSFSMSQKFKIENPRNLSDVFMCYENW